MKREAALREAQNTKREEEIERGRQTSRDVWGKDCRRDKSGSGWYLPIPMRRASLNKGRTRSRVVGFGTSVGVTVQCSEPDVDRSTLKTLGRGNRARVEEGPTGVRGPVEHGSHGVAVVPPRLRDYLGTYLTSSPLQPHASPHLPTLLITSVIPCSPLTESLNDTKVSTTHKASI
ncbi:hypothetical protein VTK73DRAFT_4582 [Phialemonium thermophilum]|uniref:Uncharacterized protein n=1 Tax=Phialemonium thermophilum TaxID=223376 RepID=A0ABR3XZP3_9PEZI